MWTAPAPKSACRSLLYQEREEGANKGAFELTKLSIQRSHVTKALSIRTPTTYLIRHWRTDLSACTSLAVSSKVVSSESYEAELPRSLQGLSTPSAQYTSIPVPHG